MKKLVGLCLVALLPVSSFAAVEFVGSVWGVGTVYREVIQAVGIATDEMGETTVVLNLVNQRQIKLSGPHAAVGLALTGFEGKCVKLMPGAKLESVNFVLNCNN